MTYTLCLYALVIASATACSNGLAPNTQASAPRNDTNVAPTPIPSVSSVDQTDAVTWWSSKTPCPDGATLKGSAPPAGSAVGCEMNGVLHGPRTLFHENGKRARSEVYYRGKLQGRFTSWHATGGVEEEGSYRNGLLEGPVVRYYPNGAVHREGEFHQGKESGAFKTYAEGGA
ncbi:MAG: toxin-antitoxin system YwqK family antitoxin, partial [Myxococcales bacterium]